MRSTTVKGCDQKGLPLNLVACFLVNPVRKLVEVHNSNVMTIAEVKHQAQVAPITKGSRKVR